MQPNTLSRSEKSQHQARRSIFRLAATGLIIAELSLFTASVEAQCVITDFEGLAPTSGLYLFRRPNFSGSTAGFMDPFFFDSSRVSTERALSGSSSLKVQWRFRNFVTGPRWLRLTTFQSGAVAAVFPNPEIDLVQAVSFWIYVPATTPDFFLTAGIREVNTTATCGQNGGVTGPIEFVGATSKRSSGGAPIGQLINMKNQWINVTFSLPSDPILSFTGNGTLNGTKGVLEHLAFTPVNEFSLGPYVVFMDDFAFESVTAPGIACPADMTVECNAESGGLHGAFMEYPVPTVSSGTGPDPAVVCNPRAGSFFALGTTPVVCTVSQGGVSSSCTFNITVQDTMAPAFDDNVSPIIDGCDLSNPLVLNSDPGKCEAEYRFEQPTATDDCASTVMVTVNAVDGMGAILAITDNGDGTLTGYFPVGESIVTAVADDGHGNTAEHQCKITVMDREPPVLTCEAEQVVVGACDGTAYWNAAGASDNCAVDLLVSSHDPGAVLGFGVTTVTSLASDLSGNSAMCSYTVEVLAPIPNVQFLPPLNENAANRFRVGQTIPVKVQLYDCNDNLVTSGVTVRIEVTGLDSPSPAVIFHDVDETANGVGNDAGDTMALIDKHYQFNLDTSGYTTGTAGDSRVYRVRVSVWDSAKGLILGEDEVMLESR